MSYVCRKCWNMVDSNLTLNHMLKCHGDTAPQERLHASNGDILIKGNRRSGTVVYWLSSVLGVVPQFIVLYVNPKEVQYNFENFANIYYEKMQSRCENMSCEDMAECLTKIVTGECILCRKQYDSFPTEEVCIAHMNNCFAIGYGTCVEDTR